MEIKSRVHSLIVASFLVWSLLANLTGYSGTEAPKLRRREERESVEVVRKLNAGRPMISIPSILTDVSTGSVNKSVAALRAIGQKLGKMDWNFGVDPCSGREGWITPGQDPTRTNEVTCDCNFRNGTVCHIVSIVLRSQNLNGSLPEELSNLTRLTTFDVSRNYINGTIPASWSRLQRLDILWARRGACTKGLSNRRGVFSLSETMSVRWDFSSHHNDMTLMGNRLSGRISKEITNISTLTILVVEANKLEGALPPELGKLTKIKRLFLNSNKFSGGWPSSFANLTNMRDFWISGSNITGKIPDFIKNWNQLELMMIMGTSMEGPIPSSMSWLVNLTSLRIADLNGPGSNFPHLQNLTKLKHLVLRNCSLSGEIPLYIGSMKSLTMLDLSFNNLTGQIPTTLSGIASLEMMFLRNNKLTGPLPKWIIQSNKNLDLSENTFMGASPSSCPESSVNLLSSYSSTYNNSVPPCFRKDYPCTQLPKYSSLFINCGGPEFTLNGTKYEADMDQRGMSACRIRENWAFTSTGAFMDVSENIYLVSNTSRVLMKDPTLYLTARTSPITMTYYGLCLQTGSYTVRLHFSEITFTSDKSFNSIGERVFDVYLQHKRVLENFNIESEAGGTGKEVVKIFTANVTANTLEIRFYWAGKETLVVPSRGVYGPLVSAISVTPNFIPKVFAEGDTKNKHRIIVAVIIVGVGIVFFISLLVVLKLAGFIGRAEAEDKEIENLGLQSGHFSIREIKVATRNFLQKNKIGEGGFGPVYKGTLRDGTPIAVKKLSTLSKQGNREFLNEVGMISALQHPNLVQLFGHCISGSQLMLIYEYMENNSLAKALFGPVDLRLKLDWPIRCKICIGIAKGLAYLHEGSTLKVVHRDIKATNILLDRNLNAKISDFGLAKLDEGDNTHISTRIAGTAGYIAPEYATRGHLTDKADVFSFGVVTLEVVSGQSNSCPTENEKFPFLLDKAYVLAEKGNLLELVDPGLGSEFSESEAWKMLKIALLCTRPSPLSRPKMSSVVDMLEGREAVPQAPLDTTFSRAFFSIARSSDHFSKYRLAGVDRPIELPKDSLSSTGKEDTMISSPGSVTEPCT